MVDSEAMVEGVTIRRAVSEDAAALAELAERTFRDTFEADNDKDDMAAYCATAFALAVQHAQIQDPAMDTMVVVGEGGRLVAYAQLRPGGPDEVTVAGPIELWRFYVDAPHHGRGLAQRLMAAVLNAARSRAARTLWLGVWERNERARKFYRKFGFTDVGSHTFLLGRDRQTDLVMAMDLGRSTFRP